MILYFIFKLVLSFIFSLPSSVKTTLTEDDLDGRHINAGLVMFWVTALAGFFLIKVFLCITCNSVWRFQMFNFF